LSDGAYFELLASTDRAAERAEAVQPVTLESTAWQSGRSARVRLRKWRHTDAVRIVEACSEARTRHWLTAGLPFPYALEHARSYIAACSEVALTGRGLCWCVADPVSDVCLGALGIKDLHEAMGTMGEIGYWVHPGARGRGVMSEAARLAVRHAFIPREDGGLGRKRLALNVADGNTASLHVARNSGFVEVGRDRQAQPLGDGAFADLVRFDLLVDEWEPAR
jgi:RimJ/RimL family protein N-acetyltransferase